MNSFFVPYLLIFLNHLNMNNLPMNEFELPKTWTKDFIITYNFSGSMDGSRTEIKITYDSCTYKIQSRMNAPKAGAFPMTEANRAAILKKMHELKVSTIKSETNIWPVRDGHSETLCFGNRCVSGGSNVKMSDQDKDIFNDAHAYLNDFVGKKINK